jgi:hypothetical protein
LVYLLVFHAYNNEMRGSRSKIPSKNLVRQHCAEGFNSGVKELILNFISIYLKTSVWDPVYASIVVHGWSKVNGSPEDGFVKAETCRLF